MKKYKVPGASRHYTIRDMWKRNVKFKLNKPNNLRNISTQQLRLRSSKDRHTNFPICQGLLAQGYELIKHFNFSGVKRLSGDFLIKTSGLIKAIEFMTWRYGFGSLLTIKPFSSPSSRFLKSVSCISSEFRKLLSDAPVYR